MVQFRYVGRKHNGDTFITGQFGYSSFKGQFDESRYSEFKEPIPDNAILEELDSHKIEAKHRRLRQAFFKRYAEFMSVIPVTDRVGVLAIQDTISNAFNLSDLGAAEHVVISAKLPPLLEPIRQEMLDIIRS